MANKSFFALLSLNWGGQGGIEGSLESLTSQLKVYGSVQRIGYTTAKSDCVLDIQVKRGVVYKFLRFFLTGPVATALHLAFFIRRKRLSFENINCYISRSPALTVGILLSCVKGRLIYIPPACMRDFYAGAMREAVRNSEILRFFKLFVVSMADRLMEKIVVESSRVDVYAFSENVANKLNSRGAGTVRNVFPGVRDKFKKYRGDRHVIRDRYSIPPNKVVVLYVGRLEHGKNVDVLIEATRCGANLEDALFLIVGSGSLEKALRKLAGGNVIFLGEKESDEVAELCFASDYCVLPTYEEGFGFVLAESLCLGTPVVGFGGEMASTAMDQLKRCFPDYCHVVTERGASALAKVLCQLIDVGPISQEKRDLLRVRSMDLFDWGKFVTTILA